VLQLEPVFELEPVSELVLAFEQVLAFVLEPASEQVLECMLEQELLEH